MTAPDDASGERKTPQYMLVFALVVWLVSVSALVIVGAFVVAFEAMRNADWSTISAALIGGLAALAVAARYLMLTAAVYLMREMSVTLARLDVWAEATYEQARESNLADSERLLGE